MFFNKKKKEENQTNVIKKMGQDAKSNPEKIEKGILVLGSGCAKCDTLEENVKSAMKELSINEEIIHVKDFAQIASYGVMSTPALVIDGKVISMGKVLSESEAKKLIQENR